MVSSHGIVGLLEIVSTIIRKVQFWESNDLPRKPDLRKGLMESELRHFLLLEMGRKLTLNEQWIPGKMTE